MKGGLSESSYIRPSRKHCSLWRPFAFNLCQGAYVKDMDVIISVRNINQIISAGYGFYPCWFCNPNL